MSSLHKPRETFGHGVVLNVGSQAFNRAVLAFLAVYAARVLGPKEFGIWAVLQVLFLCTAQAHLGMGNAMMREVPVALARGDEVEVRRVVEGTWGFVFLVSLAASAISAVLVNVLYGASAQRGALVTAGAAWLVFVQLHSVFFHFYCRAYADFKKLAIVTTAQHLLMAPLCLWWIPRLGIAGFLLGQAVGFSLATAVVVTRFSSAAHLGLAPNLWKRLLAIGLPMLPGTLILYLMMSLDRLLLVLFINPTAVGLFVGGAFLFYFGATLWELLIYTWYARLAALYGATGKAEPVAQITHNVIPGALWISSVGQGLLLLMTPWLMTTILPEYVESIAVAQVLVLGTNVFGLAQSLTATLTVVGREKTAGALQALALLVRSGILLAAVGLTGNLLVVAGASVLAYWVYAGLACVAWQRRAGHGSAAIYHAFAAWGVPTGMAVVASYASTRYGPWLQFLLGGGSYLLLTLAIMGWLEKRSHVLSKLWAPWLSPSP